MTSLDMRTRINNSRRDHVQAQADADGLDCAHAFAEGQNPYSRGGNRGGNAVQRKLIEHHLPEVAAQLKAEAK